MVDGDLIALLVRRGPVLRIRKITADADSWPGWKLGCHDELLRARTESRLYLAIRRGILALFAILGA
jgi:hypothetical protein